jgi:hypothetical protein
MQFIDELFHHRDWELILHSVVVERFVVDVEALSVVRLLDEEHGCQEGCTRSNDTLVEHHRTLCL